MKKSEKWRETVDPFSLKFNNFHLKEVLDYPHAGNDVFYVNGIGIKGKEITAFLKVERQKTADIVPIEDKNPRHKMLYSWGLPLCKYSVERL